MQPPTPYSQLNAVLDELLRDVRGVLVHNFLGAYLQGSFAVGDFDQHSDVDFVIAVERELTDLDVAALQGVHRRIYDLPVEWAKHLEGSYFPAAILRSSDRAGEPLWYLDHGSNQLVRSDHCNTLLVRSVLQAHGVALAGPPAADLIDPVAITALRREIRRTMQEWAREILTDPQPYANRFYQGFIALNYARMLHDLVEGRPGSKRAGAEWAKDTFGFPWTDLIDRAWATRPNPAVRVRQPADPADFELTLEFMKLCVESSKAIRIP